MSDKGSRDELNGQASGAESGAATARLCYVDDSRTSAYVVRRLLQPYGYQIDYFQSAEPAFVALIQEDYDLLLTDLKVSSKGMDGDDLIRTIRQSGHPKLSSLPVIVITGASDARVLVDVYDAGANQVMNKPVDAEELDGHIRRLLPDSKPDLRVVEQQPDRDNVVSLSAAQRPVQKDPLPASDVKLSSSTAPSPTISVSEPNAPAPDVSQPEPDAAALDVADVPDIPILDTAPPEPVTVPSDQNTTSSGQIAAPPESVTALPDLVSAPPDQITASPDQISVSPEQIKVPLDGIDAVSADNQVIQEAERVDDEKISLLERAVLKQDELKQDESKEEQNDVSVENISEEMDVKREDVLEKDIPEVVIPQDEFIDDDNIVIEPLDSSTNQNNAAVSSADNVNILHELNQHALVAKERTDLISDSNFFGTFGSLIELVGVKSLIKRIVVAGIGIFAVLMAWNMFFDQGLPVDTVFVETGEIFQSITVPGRVLSKQQVNISSAHAGRTVKILVKEGDKVKAGQVLAKLDDRELISRHKRAKANLADAQQAVVHARRTLTRLRKAFKKGAVARRFVEDAEVDLSAARSQAGTAVEKAHSASLELSKQQITAPFSGTITARFAEVGQWIGPSESLFTLVDESQREIEVRVDAADSVAIDVGQAVAVSSDAFPGLEWNESVSRLGTAANNDRNSNSVKVYISLGGDAPSLRFGQQVDADIRTAWNPNTLKVPFEALINRDGQTVVAVLNRGEVRLKQVETGIEDFSMVEIKQGLNDGEMVILSKGQMFQNGDKAYPARNIR